MSSISFQGVSKAYKGVPALDGVTLEVRAEGLTVLCGPPRSGKSVLCRLLAGLERPDAGRILLGGRDVTGLPPAERPVGYVPQSFALYPHLSVSDNIGYALALQKVAAAEIARRVDWAAGLLSITHLLKKTPDQLSGGEKQRTALARGLLRNAEVFVLDDPLVGLDYKLRERLMGELKDLRAELKATFLYATSDSLEALTMAQDLAVLDAGRLVQHDEAIRLYDEPGHLRSLELVGFPRANVLDATVVNGMATAGPFRFPVRLPDAERNGIRVGLRPEALRHGTGRGIDGAGRVTLVENLGGELVVYLEAGGAQMVMAYPADAASTEPGLGDDVALTIAPADVLLFDAATGRRVSATGVGS